jgi:glycosyltransferase involved in cell wall biosynthesis
LLASDVLVLPTACAPFSQLGFPTKLAKYLAAGKPVIVTSTGYNPKYLQHGTNAYLTPPDNPQAFAAQLKFILKHPEEALQV